MDDSQKQYTLRTSRRVYCRLNRRLPNLPGRFQPSTFGVWGLNCRVRDGNGWNPPAIATGWMPKSASEVSVPVGYAPSQLHRTRDGTRSSKCEVKASTDSYPSAASLTGLPHRTDQPCHLQGVLLSCEMRELILGLVSRLDAFSVSPFRT